jgi:SAM-dependent methyltransferase
MRAVKHPSLVASVIDRKLGISKAALVSHEGERLVIGDWASAIKSDSFVVLAHIHRYLWVHDYLKRGVCLDAGCGSGYGTNYLAQNCPIEKIVGVDIDQQAINYAQTKYKNQQAQFKPMDVTAMTFPDHQFDYILSFDVLEHLTAEGQDKFLSEIARTLEPNGTAFIGCPNGEKSANWRPNKFHLKELIEDEFREVLGSHFFEVKVVGQDITFNGVRQQEKQDSCIPNLGISNFVVVEDGYKWGLLSTCRQPLKTLTA